MVTKFSDLTLDSTPGAGSYVPYVDPTEEVAANRNKRILITASGLAPDGAATSGGTVEAGRVGTYDLPGGATLQLPATNVALPSVVTAVDPHYGTADAWSAGYPAAVLTAGSSEFDNGVAVTTDGVLALDQSAPGYTFTAPQGEDRNWSIETMRLGIDLSLASRRASADAALALMRQADFWYSSKDPVASGVRANRGTGTGTLQQGSTTGSDTNDFTALTYTADDYVWLPGTASNSITFPRPYATTHFTITYTNDTTTTGTTTSDPVVIGGTTHSGSVKSVVLRETDGAGEVGESLIVADGLTGWTVTRSTTGLKTTVVDGRSVDVFDGVDDYGQFPAAAAPTFTETAGQHTVVVCFRAHAGNSFTRIWSSEQTTPFHGAWFEINNDKLYSYVRGTVGASTFTNAARIRAITLGSLSVAAFIADDGNVRAYSNLEGLGVDADITGVGTLTHGTPRVGRRVGGAAPGHYELFDVLSFADVALTEEQLETVAAKLIAGAFS